MQKNTKQQYLTKMEALLVMQDFLEKYYERTSSGDIGLLLGEIQILQDGLTADPAAWYDWSESVEKVTSKAKHSE